MLKILIRNPRLTLSCHHILASLAVSDVVQTYGMFFCVFLGAHTNRETKSFACQLDRKLIATLFSGTVVTSTGSILLLSIERYVACFHCFRVHTIFTEERVKRIIYAIWITGSICGFIDYKRYKPNYSAVVVPLTTTLDIMYVAVVVPTSVIMFILQSRLYLLSMRKTTVHPSFNFGRQAEVSDVRRRQLKLAFNASYAIIMYKACMLPLVSYIIFTGFKEKNDESKFRRVSIFLASLNAQVDPFIYGFGMPDLRREMKRELKAWKRRIISLFESNKVQVFRTTWT
eukprot:gene7733-8573_t